MTQVQIDQQSKEEENIYFNDPIVIAYRTFSRGPYKQNRTPEETKEAKRKAQILYKERHTERLLSLQRERNKKSRAKKKLALQEAHEKGKPLPQRSYLGVNRQLWR